MPAVSWCLALVSLNVKFVSQLHLFQHFRSNPRVGVQRSLFSSGPNPAYTRINDYEMWITRLHRHVELRTHPCKIEDVIPNQHEWHSLRRTCLKPPGAPARHYDTFTIADARYGRHQMSSQKSSTSRAFLPDSTTPGPHPPPVPGNASGNSSSFAANRETFLPWPPSSLHPQHGSFSTLASFGRWGYERGDFRSLHSLLEPLVPLLFAADRSEPLSSTQLSLHRCSVSQNTPQPNYQPSLRQHNWKRAGDKQ
jgi:hypothetical protein